MQGPSRGDNIGVACKPDITGRSGNGAVRKKGEQLNGRYNYTSDEQCVSLRTAGRLEVSGLGPFGPK